MTGLAFTNPKVQRLRRLLGRRSARRDEGCFVLEGPTLLAEALAAGVAIDAVFVPPGAPTPPGLGGVPVAELAPGVLERVATTVTPQGPLAVARCPSVPLAEAEEAPFLVVAAGVSDPGNLGTILRVAEAAGAGAVVVTEGSVDPFSPKAVRASAGAVLHVPLAVDVPLAVLAELGRPLLVTAATGGVPYDEAPLDPPVVIVLGSEAHGVPAGLPIGGQVSIPHVGRSESLNVAMAAAVVCFEVARRVRHRS